ncbi:RCC1/BLIP-II [Ramaria rubella]|nr:RCC1/BLIP-II [Ramaria rubella]
MPLSDIPLEVLIDNLLPLIPLKDILSLTVTSKDYAKLCSDDTFWKRKLKEDYNFSDASSARTKGYKFLYKGVHNAKIYVWGSAGEGRLGMQLPRQHGILQGSRPYPTQLKIPGPRIVELAAGGWSFHALDSEGGVHVWGQLDGMQHGLRSDPFSFSGKCVASPMKMILPERISKIGCGRAHATALSSANRVWSWTSWGLPYVLTTPLLSTSNRFTTPLQVECGWSFSAVLTHGGEVYVWWPFDGELGLLNDTEEEHANENPEPHDDTSSDIQCHFWEANVAPQQIPNVSSTLPKLLGNDKEPGMKIVKIAAGDDFLIGLTEGGHVLKVDFHDGHTSFNNPLRRPRWEYMERFSQVEHVRTHPTFNTPLGDGDVPNAPETMQITHISAHFVTFFAYSTGSSSIVLKGSKDTHNDAQPEIPSALQHRGVISIVLGDYHFGALTSTGTLLAWGAYSSGALGLGDPTQLPAGHPGGYTDKRDRERGSRFRITPPDVLEPTEVKFGTRKGGKGRKSFVFDATASGWHTGALVIDLDV